ncbi:MAG: hypothetical protein JWM16_2549 [Verrucomicrobiales bacterium]|nr:hypothetical protein [Verrucomicrobiales bacterium]
MFTTASVVKGKPLIPKESFRRGELPVLVVQGYAEQKIVLDLVQNGALVSSQAFDIPAVQNKVRDDGFGFATHGGMGMERKATLIIFKDQYLIPMKTAPLGFYQATLKLNGQPMETIKFSVLGNND